MCLIQKPWLRSVVVKVNTHANKPWKKGIRRQILFQQRRAVNTVMLLTLAFVVDMCSPQEFHLELLEPRIFFGGPIFAFQQKQRFPSQVDEDHHEARHRCPSCRLCRCFRSRGHQGPGIHLPQHGLRVGAWSTASSWLL